MLMVDDRRGKNLELERCNNIQRIKDSEEKSKSLMHASEDLMRMVKLVTNYYYDLEVDNRIRFKDLDHLNSVKQNRFKIIDWFNPFSI